MTSKILVKGNFSRDDVVCEFSSVTGRKIDPEIEEKAIQIWQQKLEKAEAEGKKMWDQPVYRLDSFKISIGKCTLVLSSIPFSIRSSVQEFTQILADKGDEYLPMALYSSIFIETSDHKFIFGEKSDIYQSNRKFSYIGGVFNPPDKPLNADPFSAALNEVEEEIGIDRADIKDITLMGILKTVSGNAAMIFYCRLNLSAKEILSKFQNRKEMEMKTLFFAEKKDVRMVGVEKIGKEPEIVDIFEEGYGA